MTQNETIDERYRALLARDARFDGIFFVGVATTGIYCRPICRVKTPGAAVCHFFASAGLAEAAGFRPCLRCRPELAPYALQQNLAHQIWQKIAAGALNEQNLEEFATTIGLSSRQLRRVVQEEFGLSPLALAQSQRLLFAKKLIQETTLNLTQIAFAAGFGSIRRFNASFLAHYRMSPSSIRRKSETQAAGFCLGLAYRPPLAWDEMLRYLKGRAIPGLECIDLEKSTYTRLIELDQGGTAWYSLQHLPEQGQCSLQLSANLLDHHSKALMPLLLRIRKQFDLEANPLCIAEHLQHDPRLAPSIAQTPGLRVPSCYDPYELGVRAILGQQVSVAGATTLSGRLIQKFGRKVKGPRAELNHHFPKPHTLATVSIEDLAGLGLPKSRARTLQAFAQFCAEGRLQKLAGLDLPATITELCTLPGIGAWTAHYIAMRGLGFPNAFPAGDLGLQKAYAKPGSARCTEKQLQEASLAWAPWRAYAALHLWESL